MSKRRNRNRNAQQDTSTVDAAAAEADDGQEMSLESALERPDPTPENNPRNAAIESIAEKVGAAFEADNASAKDILYEDEDGNITSAPPTEDANEGEEGSEGAGDGEEGADTGEIADTVLEGARRTDDGSIVDDQGQTIDPNAEYEIESEGIVKKVRGSQIIEAGRRTLQKHEAVDLRLDLANKLLEEAKRRASGPSPKGDVDSSGSVDGATGTPTGEDDKELIDLADKIQYGTKEQAVEALRKLRASQPTVTPDQVLGFVASRLGPMMARQKEFFDAVDFAKTEYADLLEVPVVRTLFFQEENRRRAPRERGGEGDRRSWKELYTAIGEDLRKQLKMPRPATASGGNGKNGESFEERRQAKRIGPRGVPNTAGGRVQGDAPPKEPTRKDVLNEMRAARHQPTQ